MADVDDFLVDEDAGDCGWPRPQAAAPMPILLTMRQAGQVMGLSERTIWGLVNDGELPAVRFGRAVRIAYDDLKALAERRKVRGGEK